MEDGPNAQTLTVNHQFELIFLTTMVVLFIRTIIIIGSSFLHPDEREGAKPSGYSVEAFEHWKPLAGIWVAIFITANFGLDWYFLFFNTSSPMFLLMFAMIVFPSVFEWLENWRAERRDDLLRSRNAGNQASTRTWVIKDPVGSKKRAKENIINRFKRKIPNIGRNSGRAGLRGKK